MKKLLLLFVLLSTFVSRGQIARPCLAPSGIVINAPVLKCSEEGVELSATAVNGTIFKWTSVDGYEILDSSTSTPTVFKPGDYKVTVSNDCALSSTEALVEVSGIEKLNVEIEKTGDLSCLNPKVTLSTNLVNDAKYKYKWINATGGIIGDQPQIQLINSGTFGLIVTDSETGCESSLRTIVVSGSTTPPTVIIAPYDVFNGTSDGLDATQSSSGTNFSYLWETTDGKMSSGSQSLTPVIEQGGTYKLTITNTSTGCKASNSITVNNRVIGIIGDAVSGVTDNWDVEINMTTEDGVVYTLENQKLYNGGLKFRQDTNWDHSWGGTSFPEGNGEHNGGNNIPLVEGNYAITFDLSIPKYTFKDLCPSTFIIARDGVLDCKVGSSVRLFHPNPNQVRDTFTWTSSTINGFSESGPSIDVVEAGTYELTVSNADCPDGQKTSIVVNKSGAPVISIDQSFILDIKGINTVDLEATGPFSGVTYKWTGGPDDVTITNDNTLTPKVDRVGEYTLTATDDVTGCSSTATAVVAYNPITIWGGTGWFREMTTEDGKLYELKTSANQGYPLLGNTVYFKDAEEKLGGISFPRGVATEQESDIDITEGTYFIKFDRETKHYYFGLTDESIPFRGCNDLDIKIAPPEQLGCVGSVTITTTLENFGEKVQYVLTLPNQTVSNPTTGKFEVSQAGTYKLQVIDLTNGCGDTTVEFVVIQKAFPVVQIATPSGLGTVAIELNAEGSSVGGNYTHQWSGPSGDFTPAGDILKPLVNETGDYTLRITDTDSDCSESKIVTVRPLSCSLEAVVSASIATLELDCDRTPIELSADIENASGDMMYVWMNSSGGIISGGVSATVAEADTYTLTVTDNLINDCKVTVEFVVTAKEHPIVQIADPEGLGTIAIELNAEGSSVGANYTHQWSGPSGYFTPAGDILKPLVNEPGDYTLEITAIDSDCSISKDVRVSRLSCSLKAEVSASIATLELDCDRTPIELSADIENASADMTYVWTNSLGDVIAGAISATHTVVEAGTYTLTVTDNLITDCKDTVKFVVTKKELPVVKIAEPLKLGTVGIELNAEGSSIGANYTHQWSGPSGDFTPAGDILKPLVNETGDYTLTIRNINNNCSESEVVTVRPLSCSLEAKVSASIATLELDCDRTPIELSADIENASADMGYVWMDSSGGIISGGVSATVAEAGTYTLTVTDNLINDCKVTVEFVVTAKEHPIVTITNPTGLGAEPIELNAEGSSIGANYTHQWSGPSGYFTPAGDILKPLVNEPGDYILEIIAIDSGCSISKQVRVSRLTCSLRAEVSASISTLELDCDRTPIELSADIVNASGDITYVWMDSSGDVIAGAISGTHTVVEAGTYTLTVMDKLITDCKATVEFVVTKKALPVVKIAEPLKLGTVAIELNAEGSSTGANYTHQWSGPSGDFTPVDNILKPIVNEVGDYTLTVTNTDSGCMVSTTVEVTNDVVIEYPIINIIGNAISGDWATPIPMTTTDGVNYELVDYTLADGGLKFIQETDWDNSWGGVSPDGVEAPLVGTGGLVGKNFPIKAGVYTINFNLESLEYSIVMQKGDGTVSLGDHILVQQGDSSIYKAENILLVGDESFEVTPSTDVLTLNTLPNGNAKENLGCSSGNYKGRYNVTFNLDTYDYSFELVEFLGNVEEASISVIGLNGTVKTPLNEIPNSDKVYFAKINGSIEDVALLVDSKELRDDNVVVTHEHHLNIKDSLFGDLQKRCDKEYFEFKSGNYIAEIDYAKNTYFIFEDPKIELQIGTDKVIAVPQMDDLGNYLITNVEIKEGEQLKLTSKEYGSDVVEEYELTIVGVSTAAATGGQGNNISVVPGVYDVSFNSEKKEYMVVANNPYSIDGLVTIYPNPVHNKLSIAVQSGNVITSIKMYSVLGQNIGQIEVTSVSNVIDVSSLSSGMYVLEVTTAMGNAIVKFIKK